MLIMRHVERGSQALLSYALRIHVETSSLMTKNRESHIFMVF